MDTRVVCGRLLVRVLTPGGRDDRCLRGREEFVMIFVFI